MAGLFGLTIVFLAALKLTGCWGKKKTYSLFYDREEKIESERNTYFSDMSMKKNVV